MLANLASVSDESIIHDLLQLELFESLDYDDLRIWIDKITPLFFQAGEVVYRKGEHADSMYFVQHGRLGVYLKLPATEGSKLATLGRGESVGEMGMIREENRSANVVALRDSHLLLIDKPAFNDLCLQHPSVLRKLAALLAYRVENTSHGKKEIAQQATTHCLQVISDDPGRLDDILCKLDVAFTQAAITYRLITNKQQLEQISNFEEDHQMIIIVGNPDDLQWSAVCLRQSDEVTVIADQESLPKYPRLLDLLNNQCDRLPIKLYLLHENGEQPMVADAFRQSRWASLHYYHIRSRNEQDWRRLVRVGTGSAVGVVLSGGGARGMGHVGAMVALKEMGVEFDMIGGTSMGAIVGGLVAQERSWTQMHEMFQHFFIDHNPLGDWTLPITSLAKGKRLSRYLNQAYGEQLIEDLWYPFFGVASGLNSAKAFAISSGKLWKALRASASLPGIVPPFEIDGEMMIDGGMLNNLPVDLMRERGANKIIAIDLQSSNCWNTGNTETLPSHSISDKLKQMFNLRNKPHLISVLMRATLLGGSCFSNESIADADYFVRLPLDKFSLLDWKSLYDITDIAYHYMIKDVGQDYFAPLITRS